MGHSGTKVTEACRDRPEKTLKSLDLPQEPVGTQRLQEALNGRIPEIPLKRIPVKLLR